MRILSPMSQDDEAERESERRLGYNDEHEDEEFNKGEKDNKTGKWRRSVESAIVKMTAEIAALREQMIASGREYQGRKQRTVGKWLGWLFWGAVKHFVVDAFVLGLVLLWLRKRKDVRLEDLVREGLKIWREYRRKILPPR